MLVIETLHDATGKDLPGPEVVQDEIPVIAQHPRRFFHRFDTRPHRLPTPFVEEFAGPRRRVVLPKFLERFLEQVSADRFQVQLKKVPQPEPLVWGEIPFALEPTPACLL